MQHDVGCAFCPSGVRSSCALPLTAGGRAPTVVRTSQTNRHSSATRRGAEATRSRFVGLRWLLRCNTWVSFRLVPNRRRCAFVVIAVVGPFSSRQGAIGETFSPRNGSGGTSVCRRATAAVGAFTRKAKHLQSCGLDCVFDTRRCVCFGGYGQVDHAKTLTFGRVTDSNVPLSTETAIPTHDHDQQTIQS